MDFCSQVVSMTKTRSSLKGQKKTSKPRARQTKSTRQKKHTLTPERNELTTESSLIQNLGEGPSTDITSVFQNDSGSFICDQDNSETTPTKHYRISCIDSCRFPNNPDISFIRCSMCMEYFHIDCLEVNDKAKLTWHCLRYRKLPEMVEILTKHVMDLQDSKDSMSTLIKVNNSLLSELSKVSTEVINLKESKLTRTVRNFSSCSSHNRPVAGGGQGGQLTPP